MSEPPGLQHPLGIEAVHWSAGAGSDLLVRVAGRWRRRRLASTLAPVLVIDTEHQRYRFPALPELPSVRAAQAGLWQVSFTVPASLAPYLADRLTLMLGSVSISLPPAVADPDAPGLQSPAANPIPVLSPDRGNGHQGNGHAGAAGGEAKALLDWLELELMQARRDTERLRADLELAQRKRREAEQLAHSEAALRIDLGRDHAARIRRHQAEALAVLELLQAGQIHARRLAHEIETLRRSADEAGEPRRVRSAPEHGARVGSAGPGSSARAHAIAAELAIARSTPRAPLPAVMPSPRRTPGLELELAMRAIPGFRNPARPPARPATLTPARPAAVEVRGETDTVETRLAGALLRLAAERAEADEVIARGPEDKLDTDRVRAGYVMDAIEVIARQLDEVRAVVAVLAPFAPEAVGPVSALAGRSTDAPDQLAGSVAPDQPAGSVAPDRLAAALYRLREQRPPTGSDTAPPRESAAPRELAATRALAAPPRPRWLLPALKRLLREDPEAVGAVITALLPAQDLAVAGPVSYDIALSAVDCRAVTLGDDEIHLDRLATPRPLEEVDFRIEGDLAALGRLLVYGSLRRRLSRRVARVRGDRNALSALDWLVREPIGLEELYRAGVRLDPELALVLVAYVVDPSWTAGERFTVGHESPSGRVYLLVRNGARPRVSRRPPLGPVATTIRCSDEQLLAFLAGVAGAEVVVRGASTPVASLREWIARAQRDS